MKRLDNLYVSDLEFEDSGMRGPKGESGDAPSLRINKVAPYLYTAEYNDIDYNAGEIYVRKYYPETDGACAAAAAQGTPLFGHNYDAPYDETAEFVVRTTARKGRHASIATCAIPGVLTGDMVDSTDETDETKEAYDVLPLFAIDGVNDAGVAVAMNRVLCGEKTLSDDSAICALFAARYVLDHAYSALHALELLEEKQFWLPGNETIQPGFHLLIYDQTRTVFSDLNGHSKIYENSVYPELPVMTNFDLQDWDGTVESLDEHANGIERYEELCTNYENMTAEAGMIEALKGVRYTGVYDAEKENPWYSDYNGDWSELGFGNLTTASSPEDYAQAMAYMAGLFETRARNGQTKHTVHTAVYNLDRLTLTLLVQEDDTPHRFCMSETLLIYKEEERARAAEQSIREDFANSFYYKPEVDDALSKLNQGITDLHETVTEETNNKLAQKADAYENAGTEGQVLYKTETGAMWKSLPTQLPEVTQAQDGYVLVVENGEWAATDHFADYIRYVNITVSIASDNGGIPTSGLTVTIKNYDTGDVINQASYAGQPVTFRVPRGLNYVIEQGGQWEGYHNPTPEKIEGAATNDTTCVFTYEAIKIPETLRELQIIVDGGNAASLKSHIGLQFEDTYVEDNEIYNIVWDLKEVKTVFDENNQPHTGVILAWHYGTPTALPFDAPERVAVDLAQHPNAEAGLYYYGQTGTTYKLLSVNAGDPLPTTYDGIYVNAVRNSDASIIRRGYGRYDQSAVRKWLQSDKGPGAWFVPSHVGDAAPEQADTMAGFAAGCSAQILSMAKPVRVRTAISSDGYADTYDLFFLPSVTEANGVSGVDNEGEAWEDWVDATGFATPSNSACSGRRIYTPGGSASQTIGLRSANLGYQYIAWNIKADGSMDGYTAANTLRRYTPCCAVYK